MRKLGIVDLGTHPYEDTYFLQKKILADKKVNRLDDCLILVEHPDIFTIGRSGKVQNILAGEDVLNDNGLKVIAVDRGGDITFHGYGQLVVYPILDLRNYVKDVRLFIRRLEKVLELTVSEYGLAADGKGPYTGLWVNGKKIGFIGIGVSDWITYHGISLNVNVDLRYFAMIKPCGIDGVEASSMQEVLGRRVDPELLKEQLINKFCEVFCIEHPYRYSEDASLAEEKAGLA